MQENWEIERFQPSILISRQTPFFEDIFQPSIVSRFDPFQNVPNPKFKNLQDITLLQQSQCIQNEKIGDFQEFPAQKEVIEQQYESKYEDKKEESQQIQNEELENSLEKNRYEDAEEQSQRIQNEEQENSLEKNRYEDAEEQSQHIQIEELENPLNISIGQLKYESRYEDAEEQS